MSPTINTRISEGMKAEIEYLIGDVGLWSNQTEFVKDALNTYIKKHWKGRRYAQGLNTNRRE